MDDLLVNQDDQEYLSVLTTFSVDRLRKEPGLLRAEQARIREQQLNLAFDHYGDFISAGDAVQEATERAADVSKQLVSVDGGLERLQAACEQFSERARAVARQRDCNRAAMGQLSQLLQFLELPRVMRACVVAGKFDEALQLHDYVAKLGQAAAAAASVSLRDARQHQHEQAEQERGRRRAAAADGGGGPKKGGAMVGGGRPAPPNAPARAQQQLSMVRAIQQECAVVIDELVGTLHRRLRDQDVSLPTSLRIVGYLKRMRVHSDAEMRVVFLRARDDWLRASFRRLLLGSALASNSSSSSNNNNSSNNNDGKSSNNGEDAATSASFVSPYAYLAKLADFSRAHLFDVVTQYRAIFGDDSGNRSPGSDMQQQHRQQKQQDQAADAHSATVSPHGILHGWLMRKVAHFVAAVQRVLPQIDSGASLANLLDTCMHFGQSLGRIGVDCRSLLAPLFAERVFVLFVAQIQFATARYIRSLHRTKRFTRLTLSPTTGGGGDGGAAATASTATDDAKQQQLVPPPSLAAAPLLGALMNSFIGAFNELRNCAPTQLAPAPADQLKELLVSLSQSLRETRQARTMDADEVDAFGQVCQLYAEEFVPHVVRCFAAIYPGGRWSARGAALDFAPILEPVSGLYTAEFEG